MAFSWTSYDEPLELPIDVSDNIEDFLIIPPRTIDPPKPPPPPPQPIIQEVEDDVPIEDTTWIDTSIDAYDPIVIPEPEEIEIIPLPPPPPLIEQQENEIFKVVEEMPRFPGCGSGNAKEKKSCADTKLLQYLYKNLKYPAIARENGVEGRIYIQFVVEKDGTVQDANIIRDIGAGCGQAALKVVTDMNNLPQRWTPGKQRGKSVRVLYTLPVTFKLEG